MTALAPPPLVLIRTPPVTPDEQLLQALRSGQPGVHRAAFDRFAPTVRRSLRRQLGPGAADLEDLTQEVFLRLFKKVHRIESGDVFEAYVIGIAVRVARGELTRRWRRRWLSFGSDARDEERLHETPDVDARAALRWLYAQLDRQSAQARSLFVLRYVEQLELEQVARATGLSLATVKRKLARVSQRIFALAGREPALAAYLQPPREPREESP